MSKYTINDLIAIMKKLRAPDGCPWDKVQTHQSIKKNMIEECYEAIDALDNGTDHDFANELGDVLLQVVFHAEMAEEREAFNFGDVVDEVCTKLITRHTHIFGDDKADSEAEALTNWEKNKKKEKGQKTDIEVLKDVPCYLPALMRAQKIQKKASGLMNEDLSRDKLYENLKNEISEYENSRKSSKDFGRVLFAVAALGRADGIDAETALSDASNEYISELEKTKNGNKR